MRTTDKAISRVTLPSIPKDAPLYMKQYLTLLHDALNKMQQQNLIPIDDGTYNIDGSTGGTVATITVQNGIITGVTTR